MPVESVAHGNTAAAAIRQTGSGPPRLSRIQRVSDANDQFAGAGGLSPVVSTVFSLVVVVVPSGVEVVVSVLVDASFEQPVRPRVPRLATTTSDRSNFIYQPFNGECFAGMLPEQLYHSRDARRRI